MEASAIIKGTPNLEAAEKLVNWAVSEPAMAIYAKNYAILANEAMEQPNKNIPAGLKDKLIKNDFEWAASNRSEILEEWQKRYNAKSEPKS
jgi:iron(III) transport system substrate-binding protein